MSEQPDDGHRPTRQPVSTQDAIALIGMLAVLEGELTTRSLPGSFVARLSERLRFADLAPPGTEEREVRQAINDLNHRLRFAIGEYPDPPEAMRVP